MRLDDGLLGLLLTVIAVAIVMHAQTFPRLAFMQFGPSLFPTILGVGLGGCGVALMIQSAIRRFAGRGGPWIDLDPWARSARGLLGIALFLAAIVVYGLVLPRLGYHLTTAPVLLVLLLWMRVRWWLALLVALGVTLFTHQLFAVWLRVPLPWGLLEPVAW
ncbi:MAG: tripartite tricarboxylate transporter TctB family protein [Geminicoccaceae bacterium]|nr:MAG: tripartite tricarboxylate transporter TctB family protein [Geminicoccaceae bacterium]